MDINKVLDGLDELFAQYRIGEVETYLTDKLDEAAAEGDMHSYITLLNEMIGYCRDTSQYDKAVRYCKMAEQAITEQKLEGSVAHATTLLNIANAYRAASLLADSLKYYRRVFPIYEKNLDPKDFRYASLHNNLSLLYQEMGDYEHACESLEHALRIVSLYPEARVELAVTHTNLGMSLLKLDRDDEAMEHLEEAFSLFGQDEEKDYHYSAALSAMAEAQYKKGNLHKAVTYDEQALAEIEKHVGRTQAYEVVKQNLERIQAQIAQREASENKSGTAQSSGQGTEQANERAETGDERLQEKGKADCGKIPQGGDGEAIRGLALCRRYFETYQAQLLKGFEEYKPYMAFGLVGDGSDCLGFDDEYSHDHDFGPGFCVFLKRELYDKIGAKLAAAYEKLPEEFMGYRRCSTKQGAARVGVRCIEDFYAEYIGCEDVPKTQVQWLYAGTERFRAAISGEIFADELGEFTRIRNGLSAFYPEPVRRGLLANELAMMAQTGQYNYERMLRRGEKVTAQLTLAKYMEHTMNVVYLLNRVYAPFYKWKHRGMQNLKVLPEIMDILNAIADMEYGDERIVAVIEIIAKLIVHELQQQGLSVSNELYLDAQAQQVAGAAEDKDDQRGEESMAEHTMQNKQRLVELAVQLEWEAFDKVENQGGRADCQDDYATFSIMRKSQYLTWTEEMLDQYVQDFMAASEAGINLITQKYGYMMESTAPEEFAKIKDQLMPVSDEKRTLIEQIVQIQVGFMEAFAVDHPLSASNARSIHTSEDSLYNTSYETYLRGELMTYSDDMLVLYGRFIAGKAQNGENLAREILNHTAVLYGYQSVDDLEEKLAKYS
ncbi:MAG: DUF4125 family protein [Lachnospiraceae bacterium]|nr:DUF4125 family protein [Lachnospiraceae bacterium]